MSMRITELAPSRRYSLPRPLLALLRRRVFELLSQMRSGALLIQEADGEVQRLGAEDGPVWLLQVHDPLTYAYLALGGTTGAGTAWILNMWETPHLVEVVRLFVREAATMQALDGGWLSRLREPAYRWMERNRRNSESGSRRNIGAHYDLGNDFFQLFLDDSMTYSAGVFPSAATTLAESQRRKYDLICRKLELQPGERLIEIGTGWGGFAIHAAREYGVHVTTTTISEQQHAMAVERVAAAGLQDQVTLLFQDYRKLSGQYDKLVSIEMVEAVGHDYFPVYMRKLAELLKPDGQALLQAITIRDENYDLMRGTSDFIREYIFPGGQLPCVAELLRVSRAHTDLNLFDLDDFGQDYARTLNLWREAYQLHQKQVVALGYSPEFRRMWDYYLASCEGAFLEASISVVHLLFTKPRCTRGPVRDRAGNAVEVGV
ncbi:MAG: class I SAM-dependent methyltransferase [Oceanococcaceae bacterium]